MHLFVFKKSLFGNGTNLGLQKILCKIDEVLMTNPPTYKLREEVNGQEIDDSFYEEQIQKTTQSEMRKKAESKAW